MSNVTKVASSDNIETSRAGESVVNNRGQVSADELRMIQIAESKKLLVVQEPPFIVIEPGRIPLFLSVVELWQHRELIFNLVLRDLTTRYRQTVLGATWAVIQPVGMMIVLTVFFSHSMRQNASHYPFAVFSYSALILWQYFSSAVSRSSDSILAVGGLLKKVYFPRLAAPIASVIPAVVDFAIAFVLLIGMLIFFQVPITARILLAPLFVLMAGFSALGIGLWISALHVRYRDMHHLVPFMLQLMFFASPIAYSSKAIPESLRILYQLNPMVGTIEGFRWAVLSADTPIVQPILFSIAVGTFLFASGFVFFRSAERSFADYV